MPLPSHWIDRLFARLTVTYGQAFLRQWEGVPIDEVKTAWATDLDRLSAQSIQHALDNLNPDRPPNALQLRSLALQYRDPNPQRALPAPSASPQRVQAAMGRMRGAMQSRGPRDWARALRDRENSGERLTQFSRAAWREAQGVK